MSTRKRRSRATKRSVVVLLALSATALFLPTRWTGKLISLVEPLVPFQHAAVQLRDSASPVFGGGGGAVSREAYEALERERAAIEHQAAALAARVEKLEREVALLTASRLWEVNARRLGARGRLIPAKVLTEDIVPWRSSRLLTAGTVQGVTRGAAVVSRVFTVDQGEDVQLRAGLAILLGEVFVGVIEQVGTHTSRVKLLSDVSVQMKVRIGRPTASGFRLVDRYFWLTGRGDGRMGVRDVEARDVQTSVIQVGDVVLSDPQGDLLPAAMTLGRISAIHPDRDNPLFAILTIESALNPDEFDRVYVYDPQNEADPRP